AAAGIARTFQNIRLFANVSALENVMIGRHVRTRAGVLGAVLRDRATLLEEAAIDDVLSFARAVLLWTDDLSLAETLRGPFCDLDEQSLHDLACGREEPLRAVLRRRAPERAEWGRAEAAIARAERVGREEGAFAFISHLLETGDPSGRKRLYGRLSPSAEEPLNELLRQALGYEQNHARSLQGFLNWAERNAVEIKRDPDQSGDAARVMTVHGAKGLEAPVVILLDAHRGPNLTQLGPLFFGGARGALFPVVSSSGKGEGALAAAVRSDARRKAYEEYRRLLYVAATRACDHLVVCGVELGNAGDPHGKPVAEKTWHALAEDAFGRLRVRDERDAPWGGAIRIIDCPQEVDVEVKEQSADKIPPPPPPAWLFAPAAREGRRRLAPSALAGDGGPVYSPLRPNDRMTRGKALHRLIELLPQIADAARAAAADRLLARSAAHIPEAERGRWRDEALLVVRDGAFAPVFAEGSRAEVAIAGKVSAAGGETFVSGKIDRLALAGDRLLIVDYKTNRPPPKRIEDVPEAYVAQLAAYRSLLRDIYPGARLEAALLWTYEARLTPIPQEMLDAAFERFIAAA
ncbi:MAG: PD-(D/E)XK nuclease family protein, partial [Parvularculaceae bacterium]